MRVHAAREGGREEAEALAAAQQDVQVVVVVVVQPAGGACACMQQQLLGSGSPGMCSEGLVRVSRRERDTGMRACIAAA